MCNPWDDEANDDGNQYKTQPTCRPGSLSPLAVVPAAGAIATDQGRLVVEQFPLTFEGYTYAHGHIAYVEGRPPAPLIQVQHNYAGLKQFDIDQACFLARCGYVGLAVDLYREYDIIGADDPELTYAFADRDPKRDLNGYGQNIQGQVSDEQKARALRHGAGSSACMYGLLRNPKHYRGLMRAWLDHARTHPAVHPEYAGSIGYCLGGQSLLEQVRDGQNVQAVVSFHGLLHSRPPPFPGEQSANEELAASRGGFFDRMTKEEFESHPKIDNPPNNYSTGCKVLIENGDIDPHVPTESIAEFREEMDAVGIDWRVNNHARTPHGFALAPGMWGTAYHEDADRRSTLSMLQLFAETWPEFPQYPVATNACGTVLGQAVISAAKL